MLENELKKKKKKKLESAVQIEIMLKPKMSCVYWAYERIHTCVMKYKLFRQMS